MLAAFREKSYLHPFIIWLILLAWFWIFQNQFFSSAQSKFDNFIAEHSFWFFNRLPQETGEITIIAIDESSRHHLNLKWPWRRSATASLIREIAVHSPRAIGLDIVFAGKSDPGQDQALAAALKSHPRIILGSVFYGNSQEMPEGDFIDAAHAVGFVNKPLQEGLVTHSCLYRYNRDNQTVFSLEAEILIGYLGLDKSAAGFHQQGLYLSQERFIPAPQGIMRINYLAHPSQIRIIPAAAVLNGSIDPSDIRNKIVLVGATDPLIHDEYATPLGILPGVTVVANSLLTLLSQRFVFSASAVQNLILGLVLGMAVLLINRKLNFLPNTLFSIVVLTITCLFFVYLRARDMRFAYLWIFFCGTAAYLVPNLYKYLSLLYFSNRLKNLSIIDPLTGLYSPRFFLLGMEELLKTRQDFVFAAMQMENFSRLALQLNFDQIKQLSGLFAAHLKSAVNKRFDQPIISRISNDTFGLIFKQTDKSEILEFFQSLIRTARALDWVLEEQKFKITLRGCLITGARARDGSLDDLMQQTEKLLQDTETDNFAVQEFKRPAADSRWTWRGDILEFIAYDWQERNKDLEKAFGEILRANQRLDQLSRGALTALARAIDAKSEWTAGHSERTTNLALKLGRTLKLNEEELENLYFGGLLHDIGKIGTPAHLLDKNGRLTDQEFDIVREHPLTGERILEPIDAFADLLPIVKQHHERYDGCGYPDGLAGEDIDVKARILAVADVFDALSSDRPYRAGLQKAAVLEIIKRDSGSYFDPKVVEALVDVLEEESKNT